MNLILQIENLATSVTEKELKALFTQIGEAIAIGMDKGQVSEESKDQRFPKTSALSEADQSIGQLNVYSLNGRTWRVRLPMPEPHLLNPTFEP
jgi:RNA recognition motif-containing protein